MKSYLLTLILLFSSFLHAQESEFLPVEQAFPVSWEATDQGAVFSFDTHKGYYLYQSRFSFKEDSSLSTQEPQYSLPGEEKQDLTLVTLLSFTSHSPLQYLTLEVANSSCVTKAVQTKGFAICHKS